MEEAKAREPAVVTKEAELAKWSETFKAVAKRLEHPEERGKQLAQRGTEYEVKSSLQKCGEVPTEGIPAADSELEKARAVSKRNSKTCLICWRS